MDAARESMGKIPLPDWVTKCAKCDDNGHANKQNCRSCGGLGYFGVRTGPCAEPTGSQYRILVYRARKLAGLPMHNSKDTSERIDTPSVANREVTEHWTPREVHDPGFKEQHE